MNKLKGVLLLSLIFAISVPCFGNSVAIKRKKNKWIQSESMEQKNPDNSVSNQDNVQAFNF